MDKYKDGFFVWLVFIVVIKIDELGIELVLEEFWRRVFEEVFIFLVCVVLEEGIDEFRVGLRMLVDEKGVFRSRNLVWIRF